MQGVKLPAFVDTGVEHNEQHASFHFCGDGNGRAPNPVVRSPL